MKTLCITILTIAAIAAIILKPEFWLPAMVAGVIVIAIDIVG